ncbi:MAG: HAMP domain-containing sensor histidine kinase [Clostridiales bacterium]|nr:HAMP domain-containing sensor histidine kinase [Clostridiales bacterium]
MLSVLRRKFVMYAMLSIMIVMGVLVGSINVSYTVRLNQENDNIIRFIADNDGLLPVPDDENEQRELNLTPESSISTRYFTVKVAKDGKIGDINLQNTVSHTRETAVSYAKNALIRPGNKGIIKNFRYRIIDKPYGSIIVFTDFTTQRHILNSLLFYSVSISLLALTAMFFILLAISSNVVMPAVESIEKQKQFITNAGHELKTPLAIISTNTEVLEMMYGKNDWTKSIRNQTKRLDLLIKSLLKLSRMEENGAMDITELDMSETVREIAESFRTAALDRDFKLEISEPVTVKADGDCVAQLTSILLDNAIKYTEKGDSITVKVLQTPKTAELWVSNSGADLSEEDTHRIFERFYRAETSRARKTGGYGIGLSIARSIMDSHGGKISAVCADNIITFKAVFNR